MANLVNRLRDEADLCRNETADDVAALLDEAADEIERMHNKVLNAPKLQMPARGALMDDALRARLAIENAKVINAARGKVFALVEMRGGGRYS